MSENKMVSYEKVFIIYRDLFNMVEDLAEYQDYEDKKETFDMLEDIAKQFEKISKGENNGL